MLLTVQLSGSVIFLWILPLLSLVAEQAGKLATKEIALSVTKAYANELISSRIDRAVLAKTVKQEVSSAVTKLGMNAAKDDIEEGVGLAAAKAAVKAGSNEFTLGKNLLRYKITSTNTTKAVIEGGYEIRTALAGARSRIGVFNSGGKMTVYFLDRGNIGDQTFHMSSLVVDQFLDSGFSAQGLKEIIIDTIVEKNTLNDIVKNGKGYFLDTKIGNFSERVIDILGKKIDGEPIVGDIIYDSSIEGGKYFNVTIKLK